MTAVQDVAIARLAAIEEQWCEDGTTFESRRVLGHVALDAPDVVAGALGVSHVHAQRRVALAVRLVADAGAGGGADGGGGGGGDEVPGGGGDEGSGLSGLHEVMVAGGLDAYRAGVVVEELDEAPVEVAGAVVAVLVPYLGVETAVQLRRRCRRALARISPDLLRQRATRAREACGLRRWVQEPGVDRWEGTFPSEQAAEGWAAVDALARRYVEQGWCGGVEAARARALMDLVRGQATIEVQLVVTVPAQVVSDADAGSSGPDSPGGSTPDLEPGGGDLPEASAPSREAGGGVLSSESSPGLEPRADVPPTDVTQPRMGSPNDPSGLGPPWPRGRADPDCLTAGTATWPFPVGDEEARTTSDDDLVEVSGPFPGDPVLVGRMWIRSFLRGPGRTRSRGSGRTRRGRRGARVVREECHVSTGSLLGSALKPVRTYRPGFRLAALVRARDGRCRFPGCSVAVRFCDLDHVRPWPTGPTSPTNLICLCRRHHRIKQRAGWAVRLHPDARATWTDPTGRVRTSWPRDLLDAVVLPATADPAGPVVVPATADVTGPRDAPARAESDLAGHPVVVSRSASVVEARLEVLGEHVLFSTSGGPGPAGATPYDVRVHVVAPEPHRRLEYVGARRHQQPAGRHRHPGRRRGDAVGTGPPPF
ncbi:MAG TPA: HNH endonuclease signature motif containing protein [Ornithinibacter sp.]|nr:HNH endonuclease signature motif containing protein [Ornithinibacter sp.]